MNKIGLKHFVGYVVTMVIFTLVISGILILLNVSLMSNTILIICIAQAFTDILAYYLYTKYVVKGSFKEIFGIYFKQLPKFFILGLLGLILTLFINYVVGIFAINIMGEHFVSFEKLYNTDIITLAYTAIIIAPIREELLFRGILQPMITNKTNSIIGIVATAFVFSGSHLVYSVVPSMYFKLFGLALIMGILRHKTKSILPSYFTHLLLNTLSIVSSI
jgi:hypothetical protein